VNTKAADAAGWSISASPIDAAEPVIRLRIPGGSPASVSAVASSAAEPEAASAGFHTTAFPNASAGASFQAGIASGNFHRVIAHTTPSGSRAL
jgi:hypothetical protein